MIHLPDNLPNPPAPEPGLPQKPGDDLKSYSPSPDIPINFSSMSPKAKDVGNLQPFCTERHLKAWELHHLILDIVCDYMWLSAFDVLKIAEMLNDDVKYNSIKVMVNRMHKQGYIERKRNPDGPVKYFYKTRARGDRHEP